LVRSLPVQKTWADPRYFYGAPTEKQAKRIAWHHLLRLIPKDWVSDINRSDLVVETIFGSSLHIVGLDKPQRIEGVQWDGCVIDESSDVKPKTFDLSVLPALTWRTGWAWRIGVPKRFGIGAAEFKEIYEKAASGQLSDTAAFTWPSSDIVPASAIETARSLMDPRDYQEQMGGLFVSSSGGVFYAFQEEFNVRPCSYRTDLPILVCSDFNVDPMAWVLAHKLGDRIEVFDMIWLRNTNTAEALRVLKTRYGHHPSGFQFYGDATGRARRTSAAVSDYFQILNDPDFRRLGRTIHYLYSNPPMADRFAATNALICSADGRRRLFIDPGVRCRPLIDDLRMRVYKPGSREVNDVGDLGHATDGLGYMVYKLFPIRLKAPGRSDIVVSAGQ
jgi:hypothetical protein